MDILSTVEHLVNDAQNAILGYQEFCNKYPTIDIDFLKYAGLIHAIPKDWLTKIRQPHWGKPYMTMNARLDQVPKISRFIYHYQRDAISINTAKQTLWEFELGKQFTAKQWYEINMEALCVTNCTTLRYFQYRLMQRIIVTNVKLKIWHMKDSDLGTFCKEYKETIDYLLWNCVFIRKLWKALQKWLKYTLQINCIINYENVILNNAVTYPAALINTLILITKYYIYASRCRDSTPTFIPLLTKINDFCNTEKIVAIRQDTLRKHNCKWLNYTGK